MAGPLVVLPHARANWQRLTIQQAQQTTLSSSQQADFQRSHYEAVSATGIRADAPLIEQGQWNRSVGYLPASPGEAFTLQLTSQPADPEPPLTLDAVAAPARSLTTSVAPRALQVSRNPDGTLQAGPGRDASEVQLTVTQTYTVF